MIRENITLAIAILGAVGTIGTWILLSFIHAGTSAFQLKRYVPLDRSVAICITILNKSRLPICISNISLVHGGKNNSEKKIFHNFYFLVFLPELSLHSFGSKISRPLMPFQLWGFLQPHPPLVHLH